MGLFAYPSQKISVKKKERKSVYNFVLCLCIMSHACSRWTGEILFHLYYACMLCYVSRVQFCVSIWTIACQAPLPMGLFQQERWSGLPCPPAGDLRYPRMEHASLTCPVLAGGFITTSATWEFPPFSPLEKCNKNPLVILVVPFLKVVFNECR